MNIKCQVSAGRVILAYSWKMHESIAHAAPGKAETRSEFFENCRFWGLENNKEKLILNYLKFPDKITQRIFKAHLFSQAYG